MSGSTHKIVKHTSLPGLLLYVIFVSVNVCKAADHAPLVAFLNEKIQTRDSAVIVEKVIVYPNEESVYGTELENYGMPVTEEYGKGPVVVLLVEKPADSQNLYLLNHDWLQVELFSDGKKLGSSGGGEIGANRMIYGFTFWVAVGESPGQSFELDTLGDLDLVVTVLKHEKVFDIPLHNIPRGDQPIFEDENVQIQEVRWRTDELQKKATVQVEINNKTASTYYGLAYKRSEGSTASSGVSHFETVGQMTMDISGGRTPSVEFWKVVPLETRKISSLKLLPWSDHPKAGNN